MHALSVLVSPDFHARKGVHAMQSVVAGGYAMLALYLALWACGLLHWLWVIAFGACFVAALAETGEQRWQR
jgi:hypothetical protein